MRQRLRALWQSMRSRIMRALVVIRRRVPYGLRSLLGVLLVIGGLLAFLPVLGLWMLPLGVLVIGLDVAEWRERRKARLAPAPQPQAQRPGDAAPPPRDDAAP